MSKLNKAHERASEAYSKYVIENYELDCEITFEEDGVTVEGNPFAIHSFHAEKVHMLEAEDGYLFGIRAHHFVVEEGSSEDHYRGDEEEGYQRRKSIVVSANHKGIRIQKYFVGEWEDVEWEN